MNIRKNIGAADRVIRFLAAIMLVILLVSHTIPAGGRELLGWTAVAILVITALDETCPIYILLGMNTRRKKHYATKDQIDEKA